MSVNKSLSPLFPSAHAESWLAANPDLFVSEESLRYFLRKHRQELVEVGAIVLLRDTWFAHSSLRAAVLNIARRAAVKAAAR